MRLLFVSSSLPHSLALENQISSEKDELLSKKVVSKTFASASQVRSPILAKTPLALSTLDQFVHRRDVPRRSRSHSTTSQRASISLINAEEPATSETSASKSVWKFTEMPGHASISAASNVPDGTEKLFVGWPGPIQNEEGKQVDYSTLPPETIESIKTLYRKETESVPVFLDSSSIKGHANYCNNTLWPIFHYLVWENPMKQCKEILRDWTEYVKVNEAFAEKILEVYKAGDIIWILDHHLLLLPGLLRQKLQSVPIGLYLRNTFPSSELFRCLPQAEELLRGMLGANLIGFQAYAYARHFTSCCTRVLGLEASLQRIEYEGAPVQLVVIPTGVEATEVFETLNSFEVKEKYDRFIEMYRGMAVLVGIDRFNQSKGIIHKLKSYERFLKDHPEWIGRVILIQVILPEQEISNFSIAEAKPSADLSLITDKAAQINSLHGTMEYAPISIYHQDIELAEYYALLQVADCYISTKERDSISMVPLDYVLSQEVNGKCSPIVLSEFTALSGSMGTSLLINPWDHTAVSNAIHIALTMSPAEKTSRHKVLLEYAVNNTRNDWSRSFINSLIASQEMIEKYGPTAYLDFSSVKTLYKKTGDRYFFLDYDGTLTPIVKTPAAATPGSKTLESLKRLTTDPLNKVFVISGRDQVTLEHWLGGIDNLGMSAEHGCFLKMPGGSKEDWQDLIADHNDEWKTEVMQVFDYFTERTPGSFVERKSASLTWHYRQCDPEFGSWQAKQCQSLLENTISGKMAVEILAGKKNLEVRPISINKGQTLRRILSEGTDRIQADFVFCAGDDRTDEDMFKALMELEENKEFKDEETSEKGRIVTCTIGPAEKKTLAKYHVNNPDQLINLLLQLTTEK